MDQVTPPPPPSPEFVAMLILVTAMIRMLTPDRNQDFLAALTVAIEKTEAEPYSRDEALEDAVRGGVAWSRGLAKSLAATFNSS